GVSSNATLVIADLVLPTPLQIASFPSSRFSLAAPTRPPPSRQIPVLTLSLIYAFPTNAADQNRHRWRWRCAPLRSLEKHAGKHSAPAACENSMSPQSRCAIFVLSPAA